MTITKDIPTDLIAAAKALAARTKGVDPADLIARTDDGLSLGPIYPAATATSGLRSNAWSVYQRIDATDPDAAAIAIAISGGARGVTLVSVPDDWPAFLRRLPFETFDIRIDTSVVPAVDNDLSAILVDSGQLQNIVSVVHDPVTAVAIGDAPRMAPTEAFDAFLKVSTAITAHEAFGFTIVADGRPWHNAGASEAQEFAAVLGSVVAYLRHAESRGADLEKIAHQLGVMLAADCDQFVTIAKFRAARLLLARLAEVLALPVDAISIHAETGWRMMCRRDPYLNLLRMTTATLAAAAGGAASITTLPYDLRASPFADRMARNLQTVARDEAALNRVADPGAGSGAVEALTDEIASAAWTAFQQLETEGGLLASIEAGAVQKRIAEMAAQRRDRVARREIEIVGVNTHVDRTVPLPPPVDAPSEANTGARTLHPERLAEPFERLCDRAATMAETGVRPAVFVAALDGADTGPTSDALATFGLTVLDEGRVDGTQELIARFAQSGAKAAAIIAGNDAVDIAATVTALRDAGAAFVVVAGDAEVPGADATLGPTTDLPALGSRILDAIVAAPN